MRSIAIMIVIMGHYADFFQSHLGYIVPIVDKPLHAIFSYLITEFDGVDLFFVLSGFLIARSLLTSFKNNDLTWKYLLRSFWVKRWLRTLPNYFFALTLLCVLAVYFPLVFKSEHEKSVFPYYVFSQNLTAGGLLFFPESWSLSVEEWFYITFPLGLTTVSIFHKNFKYRKFL